MKKEIRDEIEDLAPSLLNIGNRNPYEVPPSYFEDLSISYDRNNDIPEDYFASLPDNILAEARGKEPAKVFVLNRKVWSVAASIILLCTVSFYTMLSTEPIENELFVLDLELEEAFDYLSSNDYIYMDDVLALGDIELWDDTEIELEENEDFDFMLDHATLDELDELLY